MLILAGYSRLLSGINRGLPSSVHLDSGVAWIIRYAVKSNILQELPEERMIPVFQLFVPVCEEAVPAHVVEEVC